MDLGDTMKKLMPLNKEIRNQLITQNYIIFKQFIRYFNLSRKLKRADIPAKTNIMQLVKANILASSTQRIENLFPYCFYTDGGTYNDDYYYFLHNLFNKTGVCYSTKVPSDANV